MDSRNLLDDIKITSTTSPTIQHHPRDNVAIHEPGVLNPVDAEIAEATLIAKAIPVVEDVTPVPTKERVPARLVNTQDALGEMVHELGTQEKIAVDLDEHSKRSFLGFTCLIQVSTCEKDWVVYGIKLRSVTVDPR